MKKSINLANQSTLMILLGALVVILAVVIGLYAVFTVWNGSIGDTAYLLGNAQNTTGITAVIHGFGA